jgi:hypothetical protein
VESDPVNFSDPLGAFLEADPGPEPDPEPEPTPIPSRPAPDPADPPTDFPKCNSNGSPTKENQINFILTNYGDAATVAAEADKAFSGLNAQNFNAADVLGWAAAETGYVAPQDLLPGNTVSGLKSGNLDYFSLTAGPLWLNQVACPSGANPYWPCFGGFQGAAEAALYSPTQYGSYQGVSNVSAGYVLGQQLGSGASIATAFQVMSNALHYSTATNYGAGVQSAVSAVSSVLDCLKKNYAYAF